jgi:hypothetical protein
MPAAKLRLVIVKTALLTSFLTSASAQWLDFLDPATPLTPAGKPDLSAKAPRTADGKPDLSGVWQVEPPPPGEIERLYGKDVANGPLATAGDDVNLHSKYFMNIFIDYKRGEEPITSAARAAMATVTARTHCCSSGLRGTAGLVSQNATRLRFSSLRVRGDRLGDLERHGCKNSFTRLRCPA